MYCSKCGTANLDSAQFCVSCGQALPALPPAAPQAQAAGGTAVPSGPPETSGKAIASLVCGLLSFIFPAAIAAIILGHISRGEIRKSGGRLQGGGLALVGLIFGYAGLAIIPVLIIAAIAIPNLLRARMAANESSAIAAIHSINAAEINYRDSYPHTGFACDLQSLGGKGGSETAAGLIDDGIANGLKNGYVFGIQDCTKDGYAVTATPRQPNQSGVRSFCSREDAVVRVSQGSGDDCLESGDTL